MSLGNLHDEKPEPMNRDDFIAVQKRLRVSWDGSVTLDKGDVKRLLDEIRWLKRRLRRVEEVVEPLADAIRDVMR
jgi:hypothetical protein